MADEFKQLEEEAQGASIDLIQSIIRFSGLAVRYSKEAPAGEDGVDGLYNVVCAMSKTFDMLGEKVRANASARGISVAEWENPFEDEEPETFSLPGVVVQ